MKKIELLRESLELVNSDLFSLLNKRKSIVHNIQKLKQTNLCFDYDRELELFKKNTNLLKDLSDKELYIYSLIIESHAESYNGNYPSWSSYEHLETPSTDVLDGTNPLLLALFSKKRYASLNIKSRFQVNIK